VVADERISGREITLGAGEHGTAIAVAADDLIEALHATVADVTDAEPDPGNRGDREDQSRQAGSPPGKA
jgi:hypothetical protein